MATPNKVLSLVLPSIPSVNHMYITTRYGKKVRTKKAREWFDEAERIVYKEMERQRWEIAIKQKVVIEVLTLFPDARKRDTNNSAKALCDMLEHAGVYDNDRYALIRYMDFDIDRENPRVEVRIYLFDEEKDGWNENISD